MPSGLIGLADELHITLCGESLQLASGLHQYDLNYTAPRLKKTKNIFEFFFSLLHKLKTFIKILCLLPLLPIAANLSTTFHFPTQYVLTSCFTIYKHTQAPTLRK